MSSSSSFKVKLGRLWEGGGGGGEVFYMICWFLYLLFALCRPVLPVVLFLCSVGYLFSVQEIGNPLER